MESEAIKETIQSVVVACNSQENWPDSFFATKTLFEKQRYNYDIDLDAKRFLTDNNVGFVLLFKGILHDSLKSFLDKLPKKAKVVVVHDISTQFPGPKEISESSINVQNVFMNVAVPYISAYADSCWDKITARFLTPAAPKSVKYFLSHRQRTGQGVALSLYHELDRDAFLDIRAEFDLHHLERLVKKKSKYFVLILTPGIWDSDYCYNEIHAATVGQKPIIVVREYHFTFEVDKIPVKWNRFLKIIDGPKTIPYAAIFAPECAKILKDIDTDPIKKAEYCYTPQDKEYPSLFIHVQTDTRIQSPCFVRDNVVLTSNSELYVDNVRVANYGTSDGQLNTPTSLAVYQNEIYIADTGNSRIQVLDTLGNYKSKFGIGTKPTGILIFNDLVYVSNQTQVDVYNLVGELQKTIGKDILKKPQGLFVHEEKLYVAHEEGIEVFLLNGNHEKSMRPGFVPKDMQISKKGTIYFVDGNTLVRRFANSEKQIYFKGPLKAPQSMHMVTATKILVADLDGIVELNIA